MANTPDSNAQKISEINQFLNQMSAQAKLPSELAAQTSISDVSEVSILQKGTDDAKGVATGLLRGFRGTWDASTNTPTLIDGTGIDLDIFIISVEGSQDFGCGPELYSVGDRFEFMDGIGQLRAEGVSKIYY